MAPNTPERDIAIIGYACKFAGANDVDTYWANLKNAVTSFGPIPADRWNHETFFAEHPRENDKTYVTTGGFIEDVGQFAAMHFGIAPRRVEVMDPQHRLVLDAVRVALQDAGLETREFERDRVGTFLGVSTSEYRNLITARTTAMLMADGAFGATDETSAHALGHSVENIAPISAFSMPGVLMNMAAANVAHHWKFGGPAFTVDAACTSSLVAVSDAVHYIRAGICDTAVAGGVYLNLTPEAIVGFSRIGAISKKGACRPFDAEADGFLQGDGVGIVILKRLDLAQADGDRIHAVIKGVGINNDGDASGPMAPSVSGQIDVLRRAYKDAQVDPATVGYVECHGTATPVGDPTEIEALHAVFGQREHDVFVGSVKGNIGHTMSSAGVAGLIHAVLCVEHGHFTPQAGFKTPNAKLDLESRKFSVPTQTQKWHANGPRRAGVSAFGFGGTNCHVVLEQAPEKPQTTPGQYPAAVVLSAPSKALLASHALNIADAIKAKDLNLEDVAWTLNTTRKLENTRLTVVAHSADDLVNKLRDLSPRIPHATTFQLGPDAFLGDGPAPNLAFMFPGQGAQRVGLLRDLYETYPGFATHLNAIAATVDHELPQPLLSYLFTQATEANEAALTATEICQPVMAALGLALDRFLRDLNIQPAVTLGHSLGEFVAAAAAGIIAHEDAIRLVSERGRLMANLDADDFGAMAAVMADATTVRAMVEAPLHVANINHPAQTVVAGPTPHIETFVQRCNERDLKATRLNVSHAFHSALVAPVGQSLRPTVDQLNITAPHTACASAISGQLYTAQNAAQTFIDHATANVDFVQALSVAAEHASVFLELGAGTTLTSFANGTLKPAIPARSAQPNPREPQNAHVDFQRFIASLLALGVPVDTQKLFHGQLVSLPATPLETQRYWVIREKAVPLALTPTSKPVPTVSTSQPEPAAMTTPHDSAHNDALIALFRQQNEILAQQTALIAKQMEALGFPVAPTVVSPATAQPAPQAPKVEAVAPEKTANPTAPPETTTTTPELDALQTVLDAVASVSAFPREALKPEQQLAADLGFDSLMFVDLGTQLTKAVPGLSLAPDAFNPKTTIGDVAALLQNPSTPAAPKDAAPHPPARGPLKRYEVIPGHAPLRRAVHLPLTGTVAISTDNYAIGAQLANRLAAQGTKVALFGTVRTATKHPNHVADTRATALAELVKAHDDVSTLVYIAEHEDPTDVAVDAHLVFQALKHAPERLLVVAGPHPAHAAAVGFAKSASREFPDMRVQNVVFQSKVDAAAILEDELHTGVVDLDVTYGPERHIPTYVHTPMLASDVDWKNEVVLVTGGSRGIGKMLADELLKRGARVVTTGRNGTVLSSENHRFVPWDVTASPNEHTLAALQSLGPITTLIHSAGLIRDGLVASKRERDIRDVVAVKTTGLLNALDVAPNAQKIAVFSSWAGHFGNRAQTDYAAANEAMRALTHELRAQGKDAVTFYWPAWEGTDMVASIPKMVRENLEAQGLPFMAPEEGIEAFFAEWGRGSAEVLFGRDVPKQARKFRYSFDATLQTLPWVNDHRLRNRPVLPFAFALEAAAQACHALDASDFEIRDLELLRGVEIDEQTRIEISATRRGDDVSIEIIVHTKDAQFIAYKGHANPANTASNVAFSEDGELPKNLEIDDYYANHSFHGPQMRAISKIQKIGENYAHGVLRHAPLAHPFNAERTGPLAVDGSLQLVLYWLRNLHGSAAYPTRIGRFVQLAPFTPEVQARLVLHRMDDETLEGSVRFETPDGSLLATMEHVEARIFERTPTATHAAVARAPEVDETLWNIEKFPEVEALKQRLEMAKLVGLRNPYFHWHDGVAKNKANIEGQEMINFSSYNYLGFSGHPEVTKAAQKAIEHYGTSVSASRLASGEIPLHRELENAISQFVGVDAALVFSAGHHANESVIGHLFGEGDLIIHDSLAHNSILTGAEMSGAKRVQFPHNDWQALDRMLGQLRGAYKKVGIMIEGVYSMDGDIPDLPKFLEVKDRHRALLYVDEAHSIGCIGPRGAGVADYWGVDPRRVDVWMGTLSKSFASCGGYIAGSHALIEYLKYTVPGFIFSAGISPANAAAALASCKLMSEHPEVVKTLQERSRFFLERCKAAGVDTGPSHDSAVVPAIVGNSFHCLQLSERLALRGINVQPIVYPAVDDDASRLRFFISATHTEDELAFTAQAIAEELEFVRSGAAAE